MNKLIKLDPPVIIPSQPVQQPAQQPAAKSVIGTQLISLIGHKVAESKLANSIGSSVSSILKANPSVAILISLVNQLNIPPELKQQLLSKLDDKMCTGCRQQVIDLIKQYHPVQNT
ncbi:MAG: hypothetical protein Faunusvirus7_6 [Faunusvirus sp.]|jgi:hypothetical protein|uniref:Uncharacterized protein n=1 Tax=Faunusvirus sp. TaxID=2487766 RepID=A0A3G4ZWH0_9VIRU|nr:MAG: hypothetical protein Faunusvirus7_6 [Faunusvirus sp.]